MFQAFANHHTFISWFNDFAKDHPFISHHEWLYSTSIPPELNWRLVIAAAVVPFLVLKALSLRMPLVDLKTGRILYIDRGCVGGQRSFVPNHSMNRCRWRLLQLVARSNTFVFDIEEKAPDPVLLEYANSDVTQHSASVSYTHALKFTDWRLEAIFHERGFFVFSVQ